MSLKSEIILSPTLRAILLIWTIIAWVFGQFAIIALVNNNRLNHPGQLVLKIVFNKKLIKNIILLLL